MSIKEKNLATILTEYDLFRDTMRFMDEKVEKGDLGVLRNSFIFIHKPLEQAANAVDAELNKTFLTRTTVLGEKADPNYVHISGTEPADGIEPGCICRILKPG